MPNAAQTKTYNFIREGIEQLRGPKSYVPLTPSEVTPLVDDGDRATFRVKDARVFIENSGKLVDAGLPDCPRYADGLMKYLLPAVAGDLLTEGNPHKPFLDLNSHTPESFESYLQTGIPLQRELPFPIAIVSRKMGNEPNGLRSFLLLRDLFEVIIRFIVLVLIADCLTRQNQEHVLAKNERLGELWKGLPSGKWVDLFCSLRQFPSENPFLVEIERLMEIDESILRHFVHLRNVTIGHGPTQGDAFYKSIFEKNIGEMEKLLGKMSFLKNYWLIKPVSILDSGDPCEFSAWKLSGDNPSFDKRNLRSRNPIKIGNVFYLNRKLETLKLDPYMIVEPCQYCDREELLMLDQFSWREITYLGYETCPNLLEYETRKERPPHRSRYPYADRLSQPLRKMAHR